MTSKDELEKEKTNKKENRFNIVEMIAVMIVTAICSVLITIIVSFVSQKKTTEIVTRTDLKEFIDTYDTIIENYYTDIDKKELINTAIKSMLDSLDDPYTTFFTEEESEEFLESLQGNYVGIGAQITSYKEGGAVITDVFDNSPAKDAKLKSGDVIIKVNGKSVLDKTTDEISNLIKGKENTSVVVTIKRDNKDKDYKLVRRKVELLSVYTEIINKSNKKIGYIAISSFSSNTYEQFKSKYDELIKDKIDYIILDLRGNTGGYLDTVKKISDLFVDKNQVLYQLQVKGNTSKIKSNTEKYIKEKTAVLVNGYTASASEILTACLKENLDSPVIGTTTYGKGKVQNTKTLSNGSTIKYTTENWLTPKGNLIDKKGIKPNYEVELSEKYIKNPSNDTDNQLQKAIKVLIK